MTNPLPRWTLALTLSALVALSAFPARGDAGDSAVETSKGSGFLAWQTRSLSSEQARVGGSQTQVLAGWRMQQVQLNVAGTLRQTDLAPWQLRDVDGVQTSGRASAGVTVSVLELGRAALRVSGALHFATELSRGPLDRATVAAQVQLRADAMLTAVLRPLPQLAVVADLGRRGDTAGAPAWVERASVFGAVQVMGVY